MLWPAANDTSRPPTTQPWRGSHGGQAGESQAVSMSAAVGGRQMRIRGVSDSVSVVGGALPVVRPPPLRVCLSDLPIPTSSPSLETTAPITMDPPAGPTAEFHWSQISQQRRCWGVGGHSLAEDPHLEPPASPRSLWGPWERGTESLWGTGARKRRQMRGLRNPGRRTARRRSQGSPRGWGAAGLQEKGWSVSLGR